MPLTPSVKKALRSSERKRVHNLRVKRVYKIALKQARQDLKKIPLAYSQLDMAAKKGVIHKNKAARLKSRLAKRANKK